MQARSRDALPPVGWSGLHWGGWAVLSAETAAHEEARSAGRLQPPRPALLLMTAPGGLLT
jgi:hypothetical protein